MATCDLLDCVAFFVVLLALPCFHRRVCPFVLITSQLNLITSASSTCLIGSAPFPCVFDVFVSGSQYYRFDMVVHADEGLNVLWRPSLAGSWQCTSSQTCLGCLMREISPVLYISVKELVEPLSLWTVSLPPLSPPQRLASALPFISVKPLIHPQNSFPNKEPDHWEAASKAPLSKLPSIYSLFPLICYTSTTLGNFYPFHSWLCSSPLLQPSIKGR